MKKLLLVLLFLSSSVFAAEYSDPARWDYTIGGFKLEDEVVQWPSGAILATGSSSMRLWHSRISTDLAPLTIIPRGFGGSTMNDVLHHMDSYVLTSKPRAILLYEGDNDVAQGVDNETIYDKFTTFIDNVHATDDSIRIYIIAVKPSFSRAVMWPQMKALNAKLAALCDTDKRLTFLDVTTPMHDESGKLRSDLFVSDLLHMNQKGYDIWRDTIAPVLLANEQQFE